LSLSRCEGITFRFFAEVVLAPAALLGHALAGERSPIWLVGIAVVALSAAPLHALLGRRWNDAVTVPGILAWFACQLVVALLPA
jgi:hypothetical protein